MTVAFPWVLWVTGTAVLGVVVAHLLSVGRPPMLVLPTARFVPEGALESVSRARRPSDVWLLLVRVGALLLAGAAFAGVHVAPARLPVASLVVLDGVAQADTAAWRASVVNALDASVAASRASVQAVVLWDGRVLRGDAASLRAAVDTIALDATGGTRRARTRESASLAGALLAARRLAPSIAPSADSLALVVVSPLREDATSEALRAVRAAWPGRIDFVPLPAFARTPDSASMLGPARERVTVRARDGDAVSAALRVAGAMPAAPTRVVRALPTADDSAFARDGGVLVWWPDASDAEEQMRDSAFGVIANGGALVAPLQRTIAAVDTGAAVAWWPDGTPAVGEVGLGRGCVRAVGFEPPAGDALLSASALGVLSALVAPCASTASAAMAAPLDADVLAALRDTGPLASAASLEAGQDTASSRLARWLLAFAVALLALEQWMRARRARPLGSAA